MNACILIRVLMGKAAPAPRWMKVSKDAVYDLDSICAKDEDMFNWVKKRLEKLVKEYLEYQSLLQERMKRLEALVKTRDHCED